MHHPNDKLVLFELVSLILAIVLGTFAFFKGIFILIIVALFLIICSILCNALLLLYTYQHVHAYKQFARAFGLVILTIWIVFNI